MARPSSSARTRLADRIQILGSLAGGSGGEPPASHERHTGRTLLRGRLASAALNEVLANSTPSGVISAAASSQRCARAVCARSM